MMQILYRHYYIIITFCPYAGDIFSKKTCDNISFLRHKNKNSYLQDKRRPVPISLTLSQIYFFNFPKIKDGSLSHFCFASVWITITSGPSGRVGRLVVRPCCRPWVGPFGSALAGLPVAAGRLAPRAADLECVCCRVES
jgi:hypothetical protein